MDNLALSVVVPTCNRLHLLKQTLESLVRQKTRDSRGAEIIVVDDGSTDGTEQFLRSLATEGKIRYVRQSNLGPSAARNAGAAVARGSIFAFTDDDCVVPSDWLKRIMHVCESDEIALAGGAVRNASSEQFFSGLSQDITNYFVLHQSISQQGPVFLTSNNMAVRADIFRAVGGFDERFSRAGGEERALILKIHRSGGRSLLLNDLQIDHLHELNAVRFLRQQINYGRGAFLLHRVVAREEGVSSPRIPLSTHIGLIRSFFTSGLLTGIGKTIWYLLGQGAVLVGYVVQSAQPRVHMKQASK